MTGVSVDIGPASAPVRSDADLALQAAYSGGNDFMARLQALSTLKADADTAKAGAEKALAELHLGQSVKAAYAEADRARQGAAETLQRAQAVAAKAKADHDSLVAEGTRLRDEAAADRANAAQELAALQDERKQLVAERAAVARRDQEIAAAQNELKGKADTIKAALSQFCAGLGGAPA